MSEVPEPKQQGEQFKAKIEQGVDRALPAEQIKNLKDEAKAEVEKSNDLKAKIKDIIKSAFGAEKTADLAITAEEKLAVFNDVKAQLSRQLGSEEAANGLMQKFGIQTADKLMNRIGLKSVEEQKLYEKFNYYLNNQPANILKMAKQIKDAPWGKDMMLKAAEKAPEAAFTYYKEFADLPNEGAKDMLLAATLKNPDAAFKYIENYKDMQNAEDILKSAVIQMDKPETALKYLSKFGKLPDVKDILNSIVDKMTKPEDMFNYLKELGDNKVDGACDVLINALLKSQNKEIAFDKIDQYKTFPDAAKVLLAALPFVQNKEIAFNNIEKFIDLSDAESVLTNALILGADTNAVFLNAKGEFIKTPYAKSILTMAAVMNPQIALTNLESYKDMPNDGAKQIISSIASSNPDLTIANLKSLEAANDELYAYSLETVAQKFPSAAILNYEKYDNPEVLKVAANNLQPRDYMNPAVMEVLTKNLPDDDFKKQILNEIKTKRNECYDIAKDLLKSEQKEAKWNIPEFFLDPAIQLILKITPDWIQPPPPKELSMNQARLIIARNLFFQKLEPSKETVKAEWEKVIEQREAYKDVKLFKDRNVIHMADNEYSKQQAVHSFGNEPEKDNITSQGAKLEPYRADYKPEASDTEKIKTLQKIKTTMLNSIVNTKPPLTFYYAGHGNANAIFFDSHSEFESKFNPLTTITYKEFAQKLIERNNKYPDEYKDKNTRPILIINTCYSSTFLRNVYAEIGKSRPLPIGLGASEYNQQTKSAQGSVSDFEQKILELGMTDKKNPSTIGMIMKREEKAAVNPTLYIPRSKVGGVQLT